LAVAHNNALSDPADRTHPDNWQRRISPARRTAASLAWMPCRCPVNQLQGGGRLTLIAGVIPRPMKRLHRAERIGGGGKAKTALWVENGSKISTKMLKKLT